MKAFFGTTTKEAVRYEKEYLLIRNSLKELGIEIQFDWLDRALVRMKTKPTGTRKIKNHVKDITSAINTSDFVVIEYTVPNFSSSHQILHALHMHKPTLVLWLKKDNTFRDTYLEGIESNFLTVAEYTLDTTKEIIKDFIEFLGLEKKYKRCNLVLETAQKSFLDSESIKLNKSKSELVREALNLYISKHSQH